MLGGALAVTTVTAAAGAPVPAAVLAQTVETVADLEALRPEWEALWARAGAGPFQSHAFVRVWAARFASAGCRLRILVLRDGAGTARAIAPFVVDRTPFGAVAELAGAPLAQTGDVLLDPWADAAALGAALRAELRRWRDVRGLRLERVREDAAVHRLLDLSRSASGPAREAPLVALDGQAPPEPESRNLRKNMRRRGAKLAAAGAVGFVAHEPGEAARALTAVALGWKRSWLTESGRASRGFADPRMEDTLLALVGPGGDPAARVYALTLDGAPIAIEAGFRCGATLVSYLGAADPAFASYGPGHLLIARTLAEARAAGVARYDLLAPADEYKLQWSARRIEERDHVLPRGVLGAAALAILPRARLAAKALFQRLPGRWRRWIAGRILIG
ncbi:GNAT family N-acetyltransferase [Salinarimonas rosea]|uniref:GNAT family N-acetyltransferase n=1 Tax=Salinarimonas rosea TaxID=552063 RepID=UPI0004049F51|nr:GNAT family N-acetyltransferase [Salinarimonas rosea]